MRSGKKTDTIIAIVLTTILCILLLSSCVDKNDSEKPTTKAEIETTEIAEDVVIITTSTTEESKNKTFEVPSFSGEPVVEINNNKPVFDDSLKTTESFEKYGPLDKRGRCTTAIANLSVETQPGGNETRGDISMIHPSGWKSGQGWERCHLIGWQLSGENDNSRNLVTGTHFMNVSGMLPYENEVAWYIEETGNHVIYEVDPIFEGKNMVCSGVHMQAESVEDEGEGISYNVFCFNVSPGHEINYKTGEVIVTDEEIAEKNKFERVYIINKNTMRFHYPSCSSVEKMAEYNKETVNTSRDKLIEEGYEPCGNCEP